MQSQCKKMTRNLMMFLFLAIIVGTLFTGKALAATGTIKGIVYNDSTPPVPISGIWVDAYNSDGTYISSDQTDATGLYEILSLPQCSSCYKVRYDTYGTVYSREWHNNKSDIATADAVSVAAGSATDLGNTVLASGGSITGTVTAGGSGLQNVRVYIYDTAGKWITTGVTGSGGSYIAKGLATGDYKLQFVPPSGTVYASEWYDNTDSVNAVLVHVDAPNETTGKNAVLESAGSISGTVQYSNGSGIAGARIDVYDSSDSDPVTGWVAGATTADATGSYTITGLSGGKKYKMRFFEKIVGGTRSGLTEWHENSCDFSSAAEVQSGDTVIAMLDHDSISGKVTDKNGSAVAGMLVKVYDSSQILQGSATTNSDGSYTVSCLKTNGAYKVQFSPMSWYNGKKSFADADSVAGGSSGIDGIFQPVLAPIYDLLLFKKRCRDANGIPVYCNCVVNGVQAYCN